MIVRELPDGRLFCIRQTSHALMAAALCRHWGNTAFEPPLPEAPVLMAIAQHDNGWFEWEQAPELRADGFPMDFVHGPTAAIKLALWERGIARAAAQHPYAGLLIRRHATLLYAGFVDRIADPAEATATEAFLAAWPTACMQVQQELASLSSHARALTGAAIDAHTRLLQFGDSVSLQVCMPWANVRVLAHCPTDHHGNYTEIVLRYDDGEITLNPWPYSVDSFTVNIHGRVLTQRTFADVGAYRAALAGAPLVELSWRVVPH